MYSTAFGIDIANRGRQFLNFLQKRYQNDFGTDLFSPNKIFIFLIELDLKRCIAVSLRGCSALGSQSSFENNLT